MLAPARPQHGLPILAKARRVAGYMGSKPTGLAELAQSELPSDRPRVLSDRMQLMGV